MYSWSLKKYLILFVSFLSVWANIHAQAQPALHWVADQKIPGYLDDTFTPFLVADQNRTAHAFASQWVDTGDRQLAVVYRKWTLAGGWTRPVDVLVPKNGDANILAVYLDPLGTIHLFYSNGNGRSALIYYAHVPAAVADVVAAWSVPVVVGGDISGVNSAALTGDAQGNLLFIYSGYADGNGVYALRSSDSGQNWSDLIQVFLTQDTTLVPFSLRLATSANEQIRATWNVVTNVGVDEKLFFANYDIAANRWSKPLELERRIDISGYFGPSFPTLVDNGTEIVITYNGGNPLFGQPVDPGRPVQRSTVSVDGGITWTEPSNPFPLLQGRSGEHTMVLDGAGRPHTAFVQRIDQNIDGEYSVIGGIWHSVFVNGGWSNPDRFVTTYSPHDVRAIVVQGNVLLVLWRQDPGEGKNGIWYTYNILDIPETAVIPLPVPTQFDNGNQQSTNDDPLFGILATPTAQQLTDQQRDILTQEVNPASPLIVGVLPVTVILVGVILIYRWLRPR